MQDSPARASVDVGTVISGTYTIEALIGRGGMGAVFLATHNRLPGKKVAIKLIHAELADQEVLARFKREAEIASMLGHPNIVGVENFDVMPDGTPYLVLEYLEGETLAHRLRAGRMAVAPAMSIVRQIGSALQAAHRAGIVHRDLKPQNIFLVPTEFDGRVVEVAKVLDFGISKMRGSQTVKTQESALLGTPQYMAPEQATGQHSAVDERTDLFALGAIVYEMLAGKPAFQGSSIPEVVFKVVYEQPVPLEQVATEVPAAIAAAVARALAKQQDERFANINELVEALTGKPLPERRAPGSPPSLDAIVPGSTPKRTGNDAFAQTMGSGDHADNASPSAVRASAPAVPPPKATAEPALARRRSRMPIVAAVAGVTIALGCAALYWSSRGSAGDESSEHVASAAAPLHPAEVPVAKPPEPMAPAPQAAAVPPTAAAPSSSPDPQPTHGAGPEKSAPTPRKSAPPREEADDGCSAKLAEAEQAVTAASYTRARLLANTALNTEGISPAHQELAHTIIGILECVDKNDDGAAMTALRQIHTPQLRARVLRECHHAGRLTGTQ
jgi:serine/threonine-protein kinase